MARLEGRLSGPLIAAVALVLVVGTAAATTTIIGTENPDPIAGAEGEVTASDNLTVDSQSLTYEGTSVTGVTVVVNNTNADPTDGNVFVAVRTDSGSETATKTGVTFGADGKTSVGVQLSNSVHVDNVTQIETTIEETG